MKKLIAAIMSICIVGGTLPAVYNSAPECVITASAEKEYTRVTDGILTFDVYDDHAEVSGIEVLTFGELIIPSAVNNVPVTGINPRHFDALYVSSITIPDTFTSIDDAAFSHCYFMESIKIPDSVTSIGDGAFCGCSRLKSITIPDSVTSIGKSAFRECSSLTSITIPDSVTSIGDFAFYGCSDLRSVTLPNSIPSIGWQTFYSCKNLTSITIPDSVTSIGSEAFCGCSYLKSIVIPNSVTVINREAFAECASLESVAILNPDCDIDDSWRVFFNYYDENGDHVFNGTIYGQPVGHRSIGSTAEIYALTYNYNFKPLSELPTDEQTTGTELKKGDANGDGGVDMSDVVMVMQAYLNPAKYGVDGTSEDRITAEGEKAGDVDGKAGLTANDALIIQRYSLKLIDNF